MSAGDWEARAGSAVLVVVDCQNDIVHPARGEISGPAGALAREARSRGTLARIADVVAAARRLGVPVAYTRMLAKPEALPDGLDTFFRWSKLHRALRPGTWGGEIHASFAPREKDRVIDRGLDLDPTAHGALGEWQASLGRTTRVVCGVATDLQVAAVARDAIARGGEAVVVEDACAAWSPEAHERWLREGLPTLAGP